MAAVAPLTMLTVAMATMVDCDTRKSVMGGRAGRAMIMAPVAIAVWLLPLNPHLDHAGPGNHAARSFLCEEPAYATITVCNQEMLADRYAEQASLRAEQSTLQSQLAQIEAQIQADLAAAKPYLDSMCGEMQQALDLVNQGIAACPNGGKPITVPSFCQLPP